MVCEPDSRVGGMGENRAGFFYGVWNMEIPVQKLEFQRWNGMRPID